MDVPKYATQEEIKRKFNHLVRVHHPDVGGDTDLFIKIKEAFATLGDEEKRTQYNKDKREKERTRIKVSLQSMIFPKSRKNKIFILFFKMFFFKD